jgi:Mor family transcriptional regulator
MTRYGTKDFLTDLHKGMRSEELMQKYNLSEEKLGQICRLLRRSDLVALRRLWEQDKLSDTQFMRAFSEVESDLNGKE